MRAILLLLASWLIGVGAAIEVAAATFEEAVAGLEQKTGLADIFVDHQKGRVLLALDAPNEAGVLGRYIYAPYLTGGLGSNPVGLDRSVPTGSHILAFKLAGNKVLAVIENHGFTASADNAAEQQAVRTSFAQSIIWSTNVLARQEGAGRILIDLNGLLLRDSVGVASRLKQRDQGTFKLDRTLSYVDTDAAHMFPINGEFDSYLTFTSAGPGREVRTTTPDPRAVTLVAHTTFRKLPEPGYVPRRYDERAAQIEHTFVDMSAPLTGDTTVRLAARFRLEKDDTGKVKNPIVFYIDNGAPEPIRTALKDGASWWAEAFEAAGFPGGYRVEVLPDGVHPLDARYNVVNWVHRATRGWSYGASIRDPRTGEILRGVVLLGSLRVRQDIKIFEALAGAGKTGSGAADDPVEIALARIRQLAAHEVGHSLGFAHNMAASTYGGRASVMDYPAPDIRLEGQRLDFSEAYGVGVGEWDTWTARFLYADQGADPVAFRNAMIAEADRKGLIYVSDRDSRSVASGHAKGGLWDNGEDAVAELEQVMAVRQHGLQRFGEGNLRPDEPAYALQTKFVPLYLYHRYQLQAVAKQIGGLSFQYRRRGDNRGPATLVPWLEQERATQALLKTLEPQALELRPALVLALSPTGEAFGDPQFDRESFDQSQRPLFDPMVAASVAVDLTLDAMLAPARLSRVHDQGLMSDSHSGLSRYLQQIMEALSRREKENPTRVALRQLVLGQFAERLISLSLGSNVPVDVRQSSRATLMALKDRLETMRRAAPAFSDGLVARIADALARARTPAVQPPAGPSVPPGSPIGSPIGSHAESCWHCYGEVEQ